jgi:hypothetical protein
VGKRLREGGRKAAGWLVVFFPLTDRRAGQIRGIGQIGLLHNSAFLVLFTALELEGGGRRGANISAGKTLKGIKWMENVEGEGPGPNANFERQKNEGE